MNSKYPFLFIILLLFFSAVQAEEQTQSERQDVTIKLHWQHQFQFAGIYAAKEKGLYEKAGLNVAIQTGFSAPYDEVENGDVEFGLSANGLVVEYLKGRPFVALGATFQNSPYIWLVRSDSGIYSARDFKGKTVTRQSYADDLSAIFLKEKIDISQIHFVPPNKNDIENLISGQVDALTAYVSNEPYLMEEQQVPYRTIAPKEYGINFYSDILFTSKQYLENNTDTVKAFREATYQGWRYAADHPDEIIDIILDKYNTQHKSHAQLKFEATQLLKLSLYPTVEFGHMTSSRWHKIAETYQQLGLYDSIEGLDDFLYQNSEKASDVYQWLAAALGILAFLALTGFQLKKHHNKRLNEQIRQHTAKIEDELQKREQLEATAKHEGMRLQALLDNTIDSVITINQSGQIEDYNKASIALFGYQPDEVVGENITMLMPASYRDLHKLGMARFLSTEDSRILGKPVEVEALHKNGQTFPIELTISDFKWEGKHLFTGVARDISKQKAEQKALIEAKQEAERANNAKSEFLSAMSHELRTPLNGILGFSQLLLDDQDQPLSEQQTKNIRQIAHSGEHLLTLINDVLELSRIEAGSIHTSEENVSVATVIEECLPMLNNLARKHDVQINVPDNTELTVTADFTKLKQVFINLVSNAIKYNKPGGKVDIDTSVEPGDRLKLTIMDNGYGIEEERQPLVFTAFERLGQEYASIEGSGVGLSVSKRLIEAMGGKIDFSSTAGQGSSFWIELPLSEGDTQTPLPRSLTAKLANGGDLRRNDSSRSKQRRQVLYVEDNPANIRLIEVFFSRLEHVSLQTCESAEAGLELLKTIRPDVILMDINLPGMSGLELTRLLRETPDYSDIPVIALTAAAMQENIDKAEGLFKAYITKPVDFSLLTRTLQPYL